MTSFGSIAQRRVTEQHATLTPVRFDVSSCDFDLAHPNMARLLQAKVVQRNINQLLIDTINRAEKVLLDLPRDGDHVEVITSSSYDNTTTKRLHGDTKKTTNDVVADKVLPTSSQKSYKTYLNAERSSSRIKEKPSTLSESTLSPLTSVKSATSRAQPQDKREKVSTTKRKSPVKSSTANKAEIVPGSVQVSPLRQMEGVSIDLIVEIKMKSGGSRTVSMQIECPKFIPKRIMMDGKWHDIA